MFHVKICGVTTGADARMVAEAGADCIGLNFVVGSPRRLVGDAAAEVAAAVPRGVLRVGVFAGTSAEEILRMVAELSLDAVQLHGHLGGDAGPVDPPELCGQLAGLPVIRAVRLDTSRPAVEALAAARLWIEKAAAAGAMPAMVIVDAAISPAAAAGGLGGTGALVDWASLVRAGTLQVPMAVAGGLTPGNVAEAIRITGLRSVDTASGVESSPGRKDLEKVRAFVAAARTALSRLS